MGCARRRRADDDARAGGISEGALRELNLRDGPGDSPAAVADNQRALRGHRRAAGVAEPGAWRGGGAAGRNCSAQLPTGREHRAPSPAWPAPQVADCLPVLFVRPVQHSAVRARRTRAGAGWPAACWKPRSPHCAMPRPARRRNAGAGSGPASGRASSRSGPTCCGPSAPTRSAAIRPLPAARRRASGWPTLPPLVARPAAGGRVGHAIWRRLVHGRASLTFFSFRRDRSPGAWSRPSWAAPAAEAA